MVSKKIFRKSAKVDLSRSDREEVEQMILTYRQYGQQEVPLIINDKLTIMVTPDKCNDRYRRQYIKEKYSKIIKP